MKIVVEDSFHEGPYLQIFIRLYPQTYFLPASFMGTTLVWMTLSRYLVWVLRIVLDLGEEKELTQVRTNGCSLE